MFGMIFWGVLILTGCTCSKEREPASDDAVIKVGRYTLTARDLELRERVELNYYPEGDAKEGARKKLVDAYVSAEILAKYGHEITPDQLKAEAARIRLNTKAPERLARIESFFQGDEEAFYRVFVLPVLAQTLVNQELFKGLTDVHGPIRLKVDQFMDKALKHPEKFETLAREAGAQITPMHISRWRGVEYVDESDSNPFPERMTAAHPNADSPEFQAANPDAYSKEADQWIRKILALMKRGDIHRHVVEKDNGFLVVKLVDRDNGVYKIQTAVFPKKSFGDWWEKERAEVKIVYLKR